GRRRGGGGGCRGGGLQSTTTLSVVGSTVLPNCVIFLPLTITRPWTIRASALRRDVTPACAMTFCNRTPWAATVSGFTSQQSFIFQWLRLAMWSNCRVDLQARQGEFPMPSGLCVPPH